MRKLTKEIVIQNLISVHGNKFDYSNLEYIDSNKKITIICQSHGEFKQRYHDHLNGSGCPACSNVKPLNNIEFVLRANEVHKNFYDYSSINYSGYENKIKIVCPIHGLFEQTPHSHLDGKGCNKCGHLKTAKHHNTSHENFIDKANQIHNNKYKYLTTYETQNKQINIVCPIHGLFNQLAKNHLQGNGCPNCKTSKGEVDIGYFLKEIGINFITQHRFEDCKDINTLPFDFYLPDYNIIIEYDGRHHFLPIKKWGGLEYLREVQKKDKIKNNYCLNNNIKLLRFKYTQKMKNIKEQLLMELRAAEGGEDAKLLVLDMRDIYIKSAKINDFN